MRSIVSQPPSQNSSQQALQSSHKPVLKPQNLSDRFTAVPVLQRQANCACGGDCPRCQAKPEDATDATAQKNAIANAPSPLIQRQALSELQGGLEEETEEEETEVIQMKAMSDDPQDNANLNYSSNSKSDPSKIPSIVSEVLRSPGQPLDSNTRTFFEQQLAQGFSLTPLHPIGLSAKGGRSPISQPGDPYEQEADRAADEVMQRAEIDASLEPERSAAYDFSGVRLHLDAQASASAQAVKAQAYTVGQHIVFAHGYFAPETPQGKRLMAHELAHVVQQNHTAATVEIAPSLQRQGLEEGDEPPLTRAEEITLSQTSPGKATGTASPPSISLFNYAIDGAALKPEHDAVLVEIAAFLRTEVRHSVQARLIGHADATGSTSYNQGLSQRRALRIKARLEELAGQTVRAFWAGEVQPVETNDTVDGRSRNRRVDIQLAPEGVAQDTPLPDPVPPIPPVPPVPPVLPPPVLPPDGTFLCLKYPLLCGLIGLPFLLPLVCFLNPALCIPIPPIPPVLPPDPPPDPPNQPPDGPQLPIVLFDDVRADNSPAGMNHRISDKDPVEVFTLVGNQPDPPLPITISVVNTNTHNGNAEVLVPAAPSVIFNTTTLQIQGTTLTGTVERPPTLRLQAIAAGTEVGLSPPFAVSAIMQDMTQSLKEAYCVPGIKAGIYVKMHWKSDGTRGIRALDEVFYMEALRLVSEDGCFAGTGLGDVQTDDSLGSIMPGGDTHGNNWSQIARCRAGTTHRQVIDQFYRMRDRRSGSPWVPTRHSGYRIIRLVVDDPNRPGCMLFVIEKEGKTATVDGATATAGATSGTLRGECPLPCPPPPIPVPHGGGGGEPGGGGTAVETLPRPSGPGSGSSTALIYQSGLPHTPTVGTVYPLRVSFRSQGVLCVTTVPWRVTWFDPLNRSAGVEMASANPAHWNLAPVGHSALILRPGAPGHVSEAQLP